MFGNPIGTVLATPSGPQQFGSLQNVEVDISRKLVELLSSNIYPDDVKASDAKITFKAGFAKLEIDIYNALYFADIATTGISIMVHNEVHPIASSSASAWEALTAYIVGDLVSDTTYVHKCVHAGTSQTPGPPSWNAVLGGYTPDGTAVVWQNVGVVAANVPVTNIGTWTTDLGVWNLADGKPFIKSTTTPAAGSYQVTAGAYVFNAADVGKTALISYVYTSASTGRTLSVINHPQGWAPTFEMWLMEPTVGTDGLHLWSCISSKMNRPKKRDNYTIPDFEGQAFANASGYVAEFFQISP